MGEDYACLKTELAKAVTKVSGDPNPAVSAGTNMAKGHEDVRAAGGLLGVTFGLSVNGPSIAEPSFSVEATVDLKSVWGPQASTSVSVYERNPDKPELPPATVQSGRSNEAVSDLAKDLYKAGLKARDTCVPGA